MKAEEGRLSQRVHGPNDASLGAKCAMGDAVCRCTLVATHRRHDLTHAPTCLLRPRLLTSLRTSSSLSGSKDERGRVQRRKLCAARCRGERSWSASGDITAGR